MEVLEGQDDLGQVETGRVLHEDALAFQVHEQLAAAQVLQDQVELAARLERVSAAMEMVEINVERSQRKRPQRGGGRKIT